MKMKILIILTITLILITSYCFGFVVFAESENNIKDTLVTEVGSNINEILKYKNYAVVRNEININVPGIYKVTYRHIETGEEIEKVVHVIEKKTKAYLYEELIYQESSEVGTYEVNSVYDLNNKPNCLFSYQGMQSNTKHHFSGEIDGGVHYGTTITMYSKGNMVDSVVHNNVLHILSTGINSMTSNEEIIIYSNNSTYFNNYTISIPGVKGLSSIGSNNKYCFISGFTNETTDNFKGVRKGNDSFLMIYNLETATLDNIIMFPLDNNDEISEIVYYKGYLYMVQTNGSKNARLIKIDIFGNTIKEINLDLQYGYHNEMLKLINNKLYLAYTKYDYDTMDYVVDINLLNEDLEINNIYYNYIPGMKLIDFNIKDGIKFILLNDLKSDTGFEYLIYDEKNNLLGKYKSSNNDYIKGISHNNVIIGTSFDKKSLKYYQVNSLIKLQESDNKVYFEKTKVENDSNINNYKYMINGNIVQHSSLSKIDYNQNVFGDYNINYYFDEYFDYYQETIIKVIPFVGAISNQTYDVGLTIKGNGTLYVDNLLIENEYVFKEPGKYQIKLLGKDNEMAYFNITISDLSMKFEEEVKEKKLSVENYNYVPEKDILINKTFTESINIENNKKSTSFIYLIPAVTLGIAILFIKKVF